MLNIILPFTVGNCLLLAYSRAIETNKASIFFYYMYYMIFSLFINRRRWTYSAARSAICADILIDSHAQKRFSRD
jgi:hypothetical protein